MRITFVLPTVNLSGGVKVVSIYAKALTQLGHHVTLVSPPPKSIPLKRKLKHLVKGNGWLADPPRKVASHIDPRELNHRVLDRWRPVVDDDLPDADVVIATWWETAEWVASLSRRKGAKVYFVQGHEVFPYLPVDRCHATYRLPLHKIVVAQWLKDVMADQYGDYDVDLVPNSVDHSQFHAPPRGKQTKPTVGMLYSTPPLKGVGTSITALRLVQAQFSDLKVVSFGSEPLSNALPVLNATEFFLSPPQDTIRDLYARCDAWLTASRTEGFNLTAIEAMACRTPVVATRTGWPAEAIESGKNGYLVDVDDVSALSQSLIKVLSLDDGAWRQMSSNAMRTVAESSWEASAKLFHAALERASRNS